MTKLTKGTQVRILSGKGCVSEMFVGKTGVVIGKCGLYPNGVMVRVEGYTVSYYPHELEVERAAALPASVDRGSIEEMLG